MTRIVALTLAWAGTAAAQGAPPNAPYPPPPYPEGPGAYPGTYPPYQGNTNAQPPYGPEEPYGANEAPEYADTDPSALTDFRSALDPYGYWRDDPAYGTVWVPSPSAVGPGFQPYVTAGHWTYDNGWTWISDYPWGAVAFHYGRWVLIPNVGWSWVPGRRYAGAWVDWRVGNGYVGWAPEAPSWIWRGGAAVVHRAPAAPRYYFTRHEDVFAPALTHRVASGPSYVNRTTPYRQSAPPARGHETVRGPIPAALGIPASRVAHPSPSDPHLQRAREFARPGRTAPPPAQRQR